MLSSSLTKRIINSHTYISKSIDKFLFGTGSNGTIPVISVISYTRNKISDETGVNKSTVVFSSSVDLTAWEARANGSGLGQGLLVGSGSSVSANTNTSFDVDYTELTSGDITYRINIYGENKNGVWNSYE